MVEQTYRYITSVEGVRSGNPVIEGTRIGVHDVAGLVLNGATVDEVIRSFSELNRAKVYSCLAYYEDHKSEQDLLIARQMADEQK